MTTVAGRAGHKGFADGLGAAARFNFPQAFAVDGNNNVLVADRDNHCIRMIVGASARVTTVSGNTVAGAVDGASARFNNPFGLAMDEGGRLLVLEFNTKRLRVVEACLVPPLLLAPKVIPAVQDPLREDLDKLLDDTALTDVTFALDGQRSPGAPLRAGCAEPILSRPVRVGNKHERGRGKGRRGGHCDRGSECGGVPHAAAVPVYAQVARGRRLRGGTGDVGDGSGGGPVPGSGGLQALRAAVQGGGDSGQRGGAAGAGTRQRAGSTGGGGHALF